MDKYLEAEKRLAELLGWNECLNGRWQSPTTNDYAYLPQWTRDWAACGPLMVEYQVCVDLCPTRVEAEIVSGDVPDVVVEFIDHPDKDTAVRYAIVQAVIEKLEQTN